MDQVQRKADRLTDLLKSTEKKAKSRTATLKKLEEAMKLLEYEAQQFELESQLFLKHFIQKLIFWLGLVILVIGIALLVYRKDQFLQMSKFAIDYVQTFVTQKWKSHKFGHF